MGVGGTGQQNVIAAVFAAAQSRRSKELEMWCVGSTRMSSAIARRRGGESTVKASTKPGSGALGQWAMRRRRTQSRPTPQCILSNRYVRKVEERR